LYENIYLKKKKIIIIIIIIIFNSFKINVNIIILFLIIIVECTACKPLDSYNISTAVVCAGCKLSYEMNSNGMCVKPLPTC